MKYFYRITSAAEDVRNGWNVKQQEEEDKAVKREAAAKVRKKAIKLEPSWSYFEVKQEPKQEVKVEIKEELL